MSCHQFLKNSEACFEEFKKPKEEIRHPDTRVSRSDRKTNLVLQTRPWRLYLSTDSWLGVTCNVCFCYSTHFNTKAQNSGSFRVTVQLVSCVFYRVEIFIETNVNLANRQ